MILSTIPLPITVIIPCYKNAATINRALQSVIDQTQQPAEVILIDDASADDTLVELEKLQARYPHWIKVIALSKNKGPSGARNAGWEQATQPYLAFLDADDSWHPEKLAHQYQVMLDHPEFSVTGHRWIEYKENSAQKPLTIVSINQVTKFLLLFKNRFNTSTVMLKTDLPFRFMDGKHFAEDFYLWQQIAFAGKSFGFIDSPLAYSYKPLYGAGGLSAQLWAMEKSELDNFRCLYKDRHINWPLFVLASTVSLLKFCKRAVISALR
jgi:glycosyltransferase involved in cell wall biosynthesis